MYLLYVSQIKNVHHGWVEIQFLFNTFYKKKKKQTPPTKILLLALCLLNVSDVQ